MRLLRHGPKGEERPAVLLPGIDGALDASPVTRDFDVDFFAGDGIGRLREAIASNHLASVSLEGRRIGAPMARPGKIVCIGLNYRNHAKESGMEIPLEPIIFMKAPNTVVGPHDDVVIPRASTKTDWEVELAVVIGREASYLANEQEARRHIAGFAISNDVSEREFQLERGGQWDKGKSCPTFNPLGPWIVTTDEIDDVRNLDMSLDLNGARMQSGNTSDMIFDVDHLVWYVSQFMVLEPGDIINTGTPAGVGLGQKPPTYLRAGDEMTVRIQSLGEQRSRVVPPI